MEGYLFCGVEVVLFSSGEDGGSSSAVALMLPRLLPPHKLSVSGGVDVAIVPSAHATASAHCSPEYPGAIFASPVETGVPGPVAISSAASSSVLLRLLPPQPGSH